MTNRCETVRLKPLKVGDTFSKSGTFTGFAANVQLTSRIVDPNRGNADVGDLECSMGPYVDATTPRTFLIVADDTAAWPMDTTLRGDLKFVEPGGITLHSQSFLVPTLRADTP